MKETKILKLKEPIIFGSETITELSIRPPRAKDIRTMPLQPTTGDMLDIAAKLTAHPPKVIDELSMTDTLVLMEIVGDFLNFGPETGKPV